MNLERGERADLSGSLHPETPRERRQMEEDRAPPLPGEEAAEDDECGEGEVQDDQQVREELPAHQAPGLRRCCSAPSLRRALQAGYRRPKSLPAILWLPRSPRRGHAR